VVTLTARGREIGCSQLAKNAVAQQKIMQALQQVEALDKTSLPGIAKTWRNALKALMESGLVTTREVSSFSSGSATPANELPLNPAQQAALEAVLQAGRTFRVFLLHGITGSGKTEVYMQLLRSVLAEPNTQALVLVPEINLTPQLEARFRTRFPQLPMVMLHSKMNESERLHGWMAAQSGEARIVIGTRLSVFTPLLHLALIVVDEEHDASYKQQDGMRYSARDVAVMRGKMANVPVVLGSATPALETWHNARSGRYQLLQIHQRAVTGAQLPDSLYRYARPAGGPSAFAARGQRPQAAHAAGRAELAVPQPAWLFASTAVQPMQLGGTLQTLLQPTGGASAG
jgi:primosomal protein N' (replication factor Y)